MKFNVGALRPATDDARAARLAAANDLVTRTLAQHGLMPGGPSVDLPSPLADMNQLLRRLNPGQHGALAPEVQLPEGAEFLRQSYSCTQGTRSYRTYVPSTAAEGVTGLVVMLHGCTQTPEDFAAGTGMNALAEIHRFIVVYPHQMRGENAQSCWNWFRRGDQMRARGEPAILAGLAQKAMADFDVPSRRVFVAGLSAGAAMAVILGETYRDVFAAVGVHSGLPYRAATDVPSAFAAMAGSGVDKPSCAGAGSLRAIVFHGTADTTVHPSNGDRIARDMRDAGPKQTTVSDHQTTVAGRRVNRETTTTAEGHPLLEHWRIEGLGHAWSGGQPAGSYTDPAGPDASAEMVRFFFDTASESN